jgi:hypothetical protein
MSTFPQSLPDSSGLRPVRKDPKPASILHRFAETLWASM